MKKVAIATLIFLATFTVIGLFLDKEWQVERSVSIDADAALIHSYVADLRTWPDWTAWSRDRDPGCVWTYSGPDFGEGMRHSWDGEQLGKGHLTITSESPSDGIEFDMVFEASEGEGDMAHGKLTYGEGADGDVTVTWTFFGEMPGLYGGWFALFMGSLAGAEFQRGLIGLKLTCEEDLETSPEEGVEEVVEQP